MTAAWSRWRSAAKLNSAWIAASRALRVRTLLPRSFSRWSRNAPTSRRVEVGDLERGGLPAGLAGCESQEQPERVAVGRDGVRAGSSLAGQVVGEECLDGGRERGHRVCFFLECLEPPGGQGEQFRCRGQVGVGVAGVCVPEVGRQPRQHGLDVGPGPVPAQKRGDRERVAEIMDSGAAGRRARFQPGTDGQVMECFPGPFVAQPAAAGGQQQGGCLRGGHELAAEPQVLVQASDGGRVQWKVPGLAELGIADGQGAGCGVVVGAVEADRLADAHAGNGQQPDQRLEGRGPQPSGQPAGFPGQGRDLLVGVEVGDDGPAAVGDQPAGRHLVRRVGRVQPGGETADRGQPQRVPPGPCRGGQRRPRERVLGGDGCFPVPGEEAGELGKQLLMPFHLEPHGAADIEVFLQLPVQAAHAASPGHGRARPRSPS